MKITLLALSLALGSLSAFAAEVKPVAFYNGFGESLVVNSDGSAEITGSCGGVHIASGFNTEGKKMNGTDIIGPVSSILHKTTLTITEVAGTDGNEISILEKGDDQAIVMQKSDHQNVYEICL